jgi:hypothetical protein
MAWGIPGHHPAPRHSTRHRFVNARETLTEKRPRSCNSLYFIADNYLDFWYWYIDPACSLIVQEKGALLFERTITPHLAEFLSKPAFERVCRQWLWRQVAKELLPEGAHFTDVGAW